VLEAFKVPVSIFRLNNDLESPYTLQGVISIERQLPHNITVATSYINVRTLHVLRTRPVNAPLPGTFTGVSGSGVRPLGVNDNIFEYESTGRFNQNQLIVNFNSPFPQKLFADWLLRFRESQQRCGWSGVLSSRSF
jgi:hypothetical protein